MAVFDTCLMERNWELFLSEVVKSVVGNDFVVWNMYFFMHKNCYLCTSESSLYTNFPFILISYLLLLKKKIVLQKGRDDNTRFCMRENLWKIWMMRNGDDALCVCVWTLFVSLKKKVFIYIGNCLDIKNITSINCTEFMFSTSIPYCWHSTAVRMGIQNFFFFFLSGFYTSNIYLYKNKLSS